MGRSASDPLLEKERRDRWVEVEEEARLVGRSRQIHVGEGGGEIGFGVTIGDSDGFFSFFSPSHQSIRSLICIKPPLLYPSFTLYSFKWGEGLFKKITTAANEGLPRSATAAGLAAVALQPPFTHIYIYTHTYTLL